MEKIDINYILSGKMELGELNLSAPTHNVLMRSGINTVSKLLMLTEDELLKLENGHLGTKGLSEIKVKIEELGIPDLHLGMSKELSRKIKLLNLKDELNTWIAKAEGYNKSVGGSESNYTELKEQYKRLIDLVDSMDEIPKQK